MASRCFRFFGLRRPSSSKAIMISLLGYLRKNSRKKMFQLNIKIQGLKSPIKARLMSIQLNKITKASKMGKKCPYCHTNKTMKKGLNKGRQQYRCLLCIRQFQNFQRDKWIEHILWHKYLYKRQTIKSLSSKYNRCINWVRKYMRNTVLHVMSVFPQPVTLIADGTFFRRGFGVCVFRSPNL